MEQAWPAASIVVPTRPRRTSRAWGFGTAGNNNGFNQDYSIYERLARVSSSTLAPDSTFPSLQRAVSQDFTIEPVLANSFETPDELTWVFDVRTDPVWHTGRPFDVDDVHLHVRVNPR